MISMATKKDGFTDYLKSQTYPTTGDALRNSPAVNNLSDEDKNNVARIPNGTYDNVEAVTKVLNDPNMVLR